MVYAIIIGSSRGLKNKAYDIMRKLERLKKEARECCENRGHDMKRFKTDDRGAITECKTCKMHCSIIPNFSYEIFGDAVAMNCGDEQ